MEHFDKSKIIICDDEIDILEICHTILHTSYNLKTVQQCGDMIETLNSFKPDLILMDLWLCGERGEDVIAQIKDNVDFSQVPIVLFSAKEDLDKLAHQLEVTSFLQKPFTGKQLLHKIEETLTKTAQLDN